MFRCCFLLVTLLTGLAVAPVSRGDDSSDSPAAADSIQLPSGTVIKCASFDARPTWRKWFPPDHLFFAEQYPEGKVSGMHSRYVARLDGASAMLHENGCLKMLAFSPGGHRQGTYRVWDDDQKMVLYAKYKDDKKDGVTCLFKDGVPWLVQQWTKGTMDSETVVSRKGSGFAALDDSEQLAKAQTRLSAVEEERAADESELKQRMRTIYAEGTKKIEDEKDKALMREIHARGDAERQRIRKEADARVAAAHTHEYGRDRVGRVAAADGASAGQDLKRADKNLSTATKQANEKSREINAALEQGSKELYKLAMAALEEAMPSDPSDAGPYLSSQQPDPKDQPAPKKHKKHKK